MRFMIHESHQKSYQCQAGTNSHLVVQFDTGTQVEVKHHPFALPLLPFLSLFYTRTCLARPWVSFVSSSV